MFFAEIMDRLHYCRGKSIYGRQLLPAVLLTVLFAMPAQGESQEPAPVFLEPSQITASSVLGYDGDNYFPEYISDNNPVTAWAEGSEGNGEGQSLFFSIPAGTKITGGNVMPGFYKNEDLFYKNSAPTVLQISSGGQSRLIDTSAYAQTWYGSQGAQAFVLDEPLFSDGVVTVMIMAVRPGWKYTDTLISELHFCGVPASWYAQNASGSAPAAEGAGGVASAAEGISSGQTVRQPDEKEISRMASMAGWVYRKRMESLGSGAVEADITLESLTEDEKAFLLYWYQYFGGDKDSRIVSQMEYNLVSGADLRDMMAELFGEAGEGEMNAFYSRYVQQQAGDICYLNGTGDFGDAGPFYFGDGSMTHENGEVCVSGSVMIWDSASATYQPGRNYRAYFTTENGDPGSGSIPYRFREVIVR